MDRITWIDPYFDIVLSHIPTDTKTIMEVGCGSGIFGFILKKTRPDAMLDGVEPFGYDLSHYDSIFRGTWKQYLKNTTGKHDVLVANETVEHMEKNDALDFLYESCEVAGKVIIVTPYKFDQQPAYDDNPYQIHRCVITVDEFEQAGFATKLIGFSNRKNIEGRHVYSHTIKHWPRILGITPTNIIATKLNS